MANHLKMALSELIVDLFRQGWSKRKIARQLGVDRGTVVRHIRQDKSTTTTLPVAVVAQVLANAVPSVEVATGLGVRDLASKAATPGKVATGSGSSGAAEKAARLGPMATASGLVPIPKQATLGEVATGSAQVPAPSAPPPSNAPAAVQTGRSKCEPYQTVIEAKIATGLTAQRIYQDLVAEHGFAGAYNSVKRFVRRLGVGQDLPFRRMECEPAAEAQIDFGTGAPVIIGPEGKHQRTHVLRLVLSHSRKAYSEVFFRQTTENLLACCENAFAAWGGVPRTLVIEYVAGHIFGVMCPTAKCGLFAVPAGARPHKPLKLAT